MEAMLSTAAYLESMSPCQSPAPACKSSHISLASVPDSPPHVPFCPPPSPSSPAFSPTMPKKFPVTPVYSCFAPGQLPITRQSFSSSMSMRRTDLHDTRDFLHLCHHQQESQTCEITGCCVLAFSTLEGVRNFLLRIVGPKNKQAEVEVVEASPVKGAGESFEPEVVNSKRPEVVSEYMRVSKVTPV